MPHVTCEVASTMLHGKPCLTTMVIVRSLPARMWESELFFLCFLIGPFELMTTTAAKLETHQQETNIRVPTSHIRVGTENIVTSRLYW